jgi:hypothetical protein
MTIINDRNIESYIDYLFKDYEKGFNSKIGISYKHFGLSNRLFDYFNSHNSLLEERIKQRFDTIFKTIRVGKPDFQKDLGFIN